MMKNASYFLASMIFASALYGSAQQSPCDNPLSTPDEAVACVEYKFQNEKQGLYNFANKSGHLGDTSHCGQGNYFSDDWDIFKDTLNSISIKSCVKHRTDPNAYFCFGTTSEKACSRGNATNNIAAIINKNKTNFVSFFPTG